MQNNIQNSFTKEHTMVTKGILIIMLLVHHVFYGDVISNYRISTIINDYELIKEIVAFCRICISGFAFITAFGMTRTFKNMENEELHSFFVICMKRLIKLEMSVIFIYILAVIYKRFVLVESLQTLYLGEEKNNVVRLLLYMCIDMVGLSEYAGTPQINVTWWYLSYAILLIVSMPFIYRAYVKFRYLLLPIGCLLPYAILNSDFLFSVLLPSVMLGTAFGYENWFEKLGEMKSIKIKAYLLVEGISFAIIYFAFILSKYVTIEFSYSFAFVIPYIAYSFISYIPLLRNCMEFIGKNATNIFLIHTFIYKNFYADFIYSFHDSWAVLLVLLLLSLGVSIVIECMKKMIHFDQMVNKIIIKIDRERNV